MQQVDIVKYVTLVCSFVFSLPFCSVSMVVGFVYFSNLLLKPIKAAKTYTHSTRDRIRQKSPCPVSVWQHVKLSDVSLGTRERNSLVPDEDVKKPTRLN